MRKDFSTWEATMRGMGLMKKGTPGGFLTAVSVRIYYHQNTKEGRAGEGGTILSITNCMTKNPIRLPST